MVELLVQLARELPAGILVLGILYVQWHTLQLLRQVHRMTEDLHRWHDVPDPRDPGRMIWWLPSDERNHREWLDESIRKIMAKLERIEDAVSSLRRSSSSG